MKNHLIIIKCHLNYLKLTSYEINIKWNAFFCYCGKPQIFFYCYDICHRKTSCVFCKNYGDCDYRNSIWYGKLKIWTFHVRHFQDKKNFNLDLSHNKMSLISCNTIWNTFPVIVVTNVWWWFSLLITMSILIFWKTNQYWNEMLEWKSTFDTVFPHLTLAVNDTLTSESKS